MSIRQNFPTTQPSLVLDFANSKTLDPRITFARPSTSGDATYMNGNGLIVTAAADEPRFDHKIENGVVKSLGLLVEEQRQNLLNYSNDYSGTGGWIMSANGTRTKDLVGPDGSSNNAWTITDNDNAGDLIRFYKQISITPSTTTNYCISSFVKNISVTSPEFYVFFLGSSTKGSYVKYDFTTDTFTSFASDGGGIQPSIFGRIFYPNGWVRIYFVVNDANSGLNNTLQYRIYPNGRDANTTGSMGLFGSQIEIGTFPTSYIPTEGSTKTRNPDNVSMTGTNFSDWYNQNEGTILASHKTVLETEPGYARIWSINDGTSNNAYAIYYPNGSKIDGFKKVSGSSNFIGGPLSTGNHNVINKTAFSYDGSAGAVTTNGANPATYSVSGNLTLSRLNIGAREFDDPTSSIHISKLTYYPVHLTNSQLQNLTK